MFVKCAPLLYGRTFNMDFASRFLVQPGFFNQEDATQAFILVKNSMDGFDFVGEHGRVVSFGNERYVVSGIAIEFKYLFSKCGQEPIYHKLDSATGRDAYGFVGVVIPREELPNIPVMVPADELLRLYCSCINPLWENNYEDFDSNGRPTTKSGLQDVAVESINADTTQSTYNTIVSAIHTGGNIVSFKNDTFKNEEIVAALMRLTQNGSLSFCSDVDDMDVEKARLFKIVSSRKPAKYIRSQDASTGVYTSPALSTGAQNDFSNSRPPYDAKQPKHSTRTPKRGTSSYDDILEQFTESPESVQEGNKFKHNREPFGRKSSGNAGSQGKDTMRGKRTPGSYDDILGGDDTKGEKQREQADSKKNDLDFDVQRRLNLLGKSKVTEGLTVLGIAAGLIYVDVGLITNANPIVLAIIGAATIVLSGIEAKRIIERYRN